MLSAAQQELYLSLSAAVTPEQLAEAAALLIDIPSPTGEEAILAAAVVDRLSRKGIDARVQVLDSAQSNAFAQINGTGGGSSLLLYAPIDTVTSNSPAEDLPWAGPSFEPEMEARA